MTIKGEHYIVCKNRQFLVGNPYESLSAIRFSSSQYDALRISDFNQAIRVAKIIGGKVMKLNTLTGKVTGGWK